MVLEEDKAENLINPSKFEILKLHGSLNFPVENTDQFNLTKTAANPYILPPIINKWAGKSEETIWSVGLQSLREAKNIIIVGYSLLKPTFLCNIFLRAGVGPNIDLNKIFVFNPVLYEDNEENKMMRERFGNCFSPQLKTRINFNPIPTNYDINYKGTLGGLLQNGMVWIFSLEIKNSRN